MEREKQKEKELKLWKEMTFLVIIIGLCLFLIIIGAGLNTIATNSNEGRMPVKIGYHTNYSTSTHFYYKHPSEVNNYLLTDIIRTGNISRSIGDILMSFGFFSLNVFSIFVIRQTWRIKKHQKENNKFFKLNKSSKKKQLKRLKS